MGRQLAKKPLIRLKSAFLRQLDDRDRVLVLATEGPTCLKCGEALRSGNSISQAVIRGDILWCNKDLWFSRNGPHNRHPGGNGPERDD
jgi:hypothetical protein